MSILVPDIAITEKVVRSVGVYLFLLIAFRLAGKRQLGQLTAFDPVVLLVISNVLQNAAIGNDSSWTAGSSAPSSSSRSIGWWRGSPFATSASRG